ncbi:MAG TPA: ornithine carbamoyltransferase [Chloroflexia bacterium]|nr:ornithine carbamoyltransferase [Chloroflexia bacterium]
MAVSMKGRSLTAMGDLAAEEIWRILELARDLKLKVKSGQPHPLLAGKSLAMIFEKPSARTRVSFEVGMTQLGGHALYLGPNDIGLGKRESVADVGRVLGRMVDGIMARTFEQAKVDELAKYAGVPVINGLSDEEHPCQILADLLTIWEKRGRLQGLRLAWLGDGNNVTHSLLIGAARVGMDMVVISPEGFDVQPKYRALAEQAARQSGARLEFARDPAAAAGADILTTDTWTSMGQEAETEKRRPIFRPYQVNADLVRTAAPNCLVMHCLPAHRGDEITDEVMDGPHSVVFDEAENRLHAQKALLALLI